MLQRFSKRGAPPSITFFAFQDIIMSAIGVLILVTILLSLQLDKIELPLSTDEESPAASALQRQTELALQEAATLASELERRRSANTANPESLTAELAALRRQVAAVSAGKRQLSREAAPDGRGTADGVWEAQAAVLRKKLMALVEKRESLQGQSADLQKQIADLEASVKEMEGAMLASRDRKNVLRLIPEKSSTSKEPVLVPVTAKGFTMIRSDSAGLVASGKHDSFGQALKKLSRQDQYVVFFFKPSGSAYFKPMLEVAKAAGFEVGYDVVDEFTELEF